jgi:hypothetical protein
VNRAEVCITRQRGGGREKGALREGAEEICEVLAVCVRPGRVVCGPWAKPCLSRAGAGPCQSVRSMRLTSERAERESWPPSQ